MTPDTVTVEQVGVGSAGYPVLLGRGLVGRIDRLVRIPPGTTRLALITSPTVWRHHGRPVLAGLQHLGLPLQTLAVPDGEDAKTLTTVGAAYDWLARTGVARHGAVLALGGGSVLDLAGFVASTWNRGIAVINLSTTLLSHVDACFGGKTAINLAAGKNLVGTFHQPTCAVADLDLLGTLPDREIRSGLGEIVKCGLISDADILTDIDDDIAGLRRDTARMLRLVHRAVRVKARLVASDERDAGGRQVLNFGHTVGQAVEAFTGYSGYRHGEAVALGMVYAARLGELLGVSPRGLTGHLRDVLAGVGLPTRDPRLTYEAIWPYVKRDKKAGTAVRFVLVTHIGGASVVDCAEQAAARRAFDVFR
jgi:3-dehydroquinate synthase